MSEFSDRFRKLKDESELSSKELAQELGIAPSTLSYYLKDREPNYDTLELAVQAHDIEKKKALKELAEEYKEEIPDKLYKALINWQPKSLKCA